MLTSKKKRGQKQKVKKQPFNRFGDLRQIPWDLYGCSNNQTHRFIRITDDSVISQAANALTFGATAFKLSTLPNSSEFTALFDQFRIDYVEVTLRPQYNMGSLSNQTSMVNAVLYTVIDYDDATAPTAVSDLRQYENCRESNWDETLVRRFQPRLAVATYASGVFTSFANTRAWVDCGNPAVEHYGFKWAVSAGLFGQGNLQTWTVEYRMALSFRNVR